MLELKNLHQNISFIGNEIFLMILVICKVIILSLTIFSILLRLYHFFLENEEDDSSKIILEKINYYNYILVLFIVLFSSLFIMYKYSSNWKNIIKALHHRFKQLLGYRSNNETQFEWTTGYYDNVIKSLVFWMILYYIVLTVSVLISASKNDIGYSTYLL